MNTKSIIVDNISKRYRIGINENTSDSLAGTIATWIKYPLSNYKRLRRLSKFDENGTGDDIIWALRDISFDVKEGDVLGIVGRNGAGKSTLLKILSRITDPTGGSVKIKGRVSSLLEVGTGFHPELTGRENVYLNGTIIGMSKKEIDKKFDEIVEFSGVKKFIDTPIKRYSTGMSVRLAFAVAAHIEPEVLIIDEVLAVGDIEFQRKCIGKMDEVGKSGRTVLFVSHNMSAVLSLCKSALLLEDGRCTAIGPTEQVVKKYLGENKKLMGEVEDNSSAPEGKKLKIRKARLLDENGAVCSEFNLNKKISLEITFEVIVPGRGYNVDFKVISLNYGNVFQSNYMDVDVDNKRYKYWEKGIYTYRIDLPVGIMRDGDHYIQIVSAVPMVEMLDVFDNELYFRCIDVDSPEVKLMQGRTGPIYQFLPWNKVNHSNGKIFQFDDMQQSDG